MKASCCSSLPPGFRFHPTDEELIVYYLKNQVMSQPCPVSIIHEVDIYKFDPWQLPDKAEFGENEWYFFSPRERKYPNGVRPNRATTSGYWKATGTDKAIYSGTKYVGIKKALVFYKGRPPKGIKTDWIMHEYRLTNSRAQPIKPHGSMRLDDWVLCRIYKKRHAARTIEDNKEEESPKSQITMVGTSEVKEEQQMHKFPRTYSLSYLLDLDALNPILSDNNTSLFDFQSGMGNSFGFDPNNTHNSELGELSYQSSSGFSQHSYGNPLYKYP